MQAHVGGHLENIHDLVTQLDGLLEDRFVTKDQLQAHEKVFVK